MDAEAASNTDLGAAAIANKHLIKAGSYMQAKLKKITSVKRRAYRKKIQAQGLIPSTPPTLEEIEIPYPYDTITIDGQEVLFLKHDSGDQDPLRFLIFTSPKNLLILENSPSLYADGTWKVLNFAIMYYARVIRFSKTFLAFLHLKIL